MELKLLLKRYKVNNFIFINLDLKKFEKINVSFDYSY